LQNPAQKYKLSNEDILLQDLEKFAYAKNLQWTIYKESTDLQNNVDLFGDSAVVIGLHNPDFMNLIFCQKDTVVIEIFPKDKIEQQLVWLISNMGKLRYWQLPATISNSEVLINISDLVTILNKYFVK